MTDKERIELLKTNIIVVCELEAELDFMRKNLDLYKQKEIRFMENLVETFKQRVFLYHVPMKFNKNNYAIAE